jgi:hypothetical protein
MLARPAGWLRAAAVGILVSWLPCVPVGLCVAAPMEMARHQCCPGQTGMKAAAAPQECWLQSPAPLPAGPPPPAAPAAHAAAGHSHPVAHTAIPREAPPAAFSPLAVVLRI